MVTNTQAFAHSNGAKIFYEVNGEGEPLILIHGGLSTHEMWTSYVPLFSKHYKIFALDSRGHGRSDNPAGTLSYSLMADDVAAFIRELDLDKPHILGYSDGGNIALDFGIRYQGIARSLMIGAAILEHTSKEVTELNSWGFMQPGVVDLDKLTSRFGGWAARWSDDHGLVYGPDHWKTLVHWLSEFYLSPLPYSALDLAKIEEPCLIFGADNDGVIPLEQFTQQYQLIPNAELLLLPGTDHVSILAKAELLAFALMDFLSRH